MNLLGHPPHSIQIIEPWKLENKRIENLLYTDNSIDKLKGQMFRRNARNMIIVELIFPNLFREIHFWTNVHDPI